LSRHKARSGKARKVTLVAVSWPSARCILCNAVLTNWGDMAVHAEYTHEANLGGWNDPKAIDVLSAIFRGDMVSLFGQWKDERHTDTESLAALKPTSAQEVDSWLR